uniref:S1 motif domain-containing protein n=1 Tax=Spongospora subterranea TaxID=70186 RepID=A0A0H5QVB0_9EUKA|eukprot:CRZ05830.1 hypothetical protein [Spongospora subterranea]
MASGPIPMSTTRRPLLGALVCPGQLLADASQYLPGDGTYLLDSAIIASVIGRLIAAEPNSNSLPILSVSRKRAAGIIPGIGDRITARVTKINTRFVTTEIICVQGRALPESFPGIIRSQDIRALEKDSVQIYNCFRSGDIVLANVISLGDSKSYLLSTAEDELGVIVANSSSGHQMIPVSWQQMQCPTTKTLEYRKVAKPSTSTT